MSSALTQSAGASEGFQSPTDEQLESWIEAVGTERVLRALQRLRPRACDVCDVPLEDGQPPFTPYPVLRDFTSGAPGYAGSDIRHNEAILSQNISASAHRINILDRRLSELRHHHSRLEAKRIRQLSLPPLRCLWPSLPMELILDIFHLRLTGSFDDRASAPLLLSHVCQLWRNIAITSPTLWSTIVMQLGSDDSFRPVTPVRGLTVEMVKNIWAPRSEAAPLQVLVDIRWASGDEALPSHAVDALRRVSSRISSLEVSCHGDGIALISLLARESANLSSLSIYWFGNAESIDGHTWTMFSESRALQRVTLDGPLLTTCRVPFDRIRTLSYSIRETWQYFNPLALYQRLFELRITIECPTVTSLIGSTPHDHLCVLHLKGNTDGMASILTTMTAPYLEQLSLTTASTTGSAAALWHALNVFFGRSNCHLHALALEGMAISGGDLTRVLRSASSVSHLTLGRVSMADSSVNLLSELTRPTAVLPNLQTLTMRRMNLEHFADSMASMIGSRLSSTVGAVAVASLGTLHVHDCVMPTELSSSLTSLAQRGLRVEVRQSGAFNEGNTPVVNAE